MKKYSPESQHLINLTFNNIWEQMQTEFDLTENPWFKCLLTRYAGAKLLSFSLLLYDEITEEEQKAIDVETDKLKPKIMDFAKKYNRKDSIVPQNELLEFVSTFENLKKFLP